MRAVAHNFRPALPLGRSAVRVLLLLGVVIAVAFASLAAGADRGHGGVRCIREWQTLALGRAHRWMRTFDEYWDSGVSGREVWVVGWHRQNNVGLSPLVGRWDGRRWRETILPMKGHLHSVAIVSSRDVWTTGRVQDRDFLLHWDGSRFSVETPPIGAGDLLVTRDGRLYLAGSDRLYARVGNRWRVAPNAYSGIHAYSALHVGPGGLWSVGVNNALWRWVGGHWQRTRTPRLRDPLLKGIAVTSNGVGFAYGSDEWDPRYPEREKPVLLRWTGRVWIRSRGPRLGLQRTIDDVAGATPESLWAVVRQSGQRTATLARRQGRRWHIVRHPPQAAVADYIGDIFVVNGDLWIIGNSIVRYGCRTA